MFTFARNQVNHAFSLLPTAERCCCQRQASTCLMCTVKNGVFFLSTKENAFFILDNFLRGSDRQMANSLTKKQRQELKDAFDVFDTGIWVISRELKNVTLDFSFPRPFRKNFPDRIRKYLQSDEFPRQRRWFEEDRSTDGHRWQWWVERFFNGSIERCGHV